ncbi:unnamed protein product [Lathyrus oleraceus]
MKSQVQIEVTKTSECKAEADFLFS